MNEDRQDNLKVTWLCTFTNYKVLFISVPHENEFVVFAEFWLILRERVLIPVVCRKLCAPSYTLQDNLPMNIAGGLRGKKDAA